MLNNCGPKGYLYFYFELNELKNYVLRVYLIRIIFSPSFMLLNLFLPDGKPLKDYGVEDSCKITLVIKKGSIKSNVPATPTTSEKTSQAESESPVWEKMRTFLRRHFKEGDVEPVLQEFRDVSLTLKILLIRIRSNNKTMVYCR